MNNERQHSEYKIIETVATPTFDGVSVETHPEDLLGGDNKPIIIEDGKYYLIGFLMPEGRYIGGQAAGDAEEMYICYSRAESGENFYVYNANGEMIDIYTPENQYDFQNAITRDFLEYSGLTVYGDIEIGILTPDSWIRVPQ